MTSILNILAIETFPDSQKRGCFRLKFLKPINCYSRRNCSFHKNEFKLRNFDGELSSLGVRREKGGILIREEGKGSGNKKRVVVVRVNQFGLNGGGGGGKDNGNNARILGNLALAIGLTYLSMTGQLGWILDAIVSVWLLAVILPIAGLGAFLWWAGQNIIQGSCPNCGVEFQISRASLKDGSQACPFCTQPFSVENDEFVSEPASFTSNRSTTFGEAFGNSYSSSKKGKTSSSSFVDIEAEVNDVE